MRREVNEVVAEVVTEVPNNMSDLNRRVVEALTVDSEALFETIQTGDGELVVTKKTYNFTNPIGKRNSMTIYDMSIIESMEKITHALHGKALLTYAICKEFSKIAESGKLENMGFKTISEFGKAVYGLETSTVNHYARIGSTFINDDYTIKAGLPDLSVSHFIELSSQVQNNDITPIIDLYASGTLVDGMSTKKIRETLKTLATPQLETSKVEREEKVKDGNVADVVPNDSDIQELQANFDSQVVIGKIINACTVIDSLFKMLNEHEVNAVGYSDNLDSIKALAKALL